MPASDTLLLTKELQDKLAANASNNIERNPTFWSFTSLLLKLMKMKRKIKKLDFLLFLHYRVIPDFSRDLTIFIISSIFLFENTSVVCFASIPGRPDAEIVFWTATSLADADAVCPNGAETLLAIGISTLFINGKATLANGGRKLSHLPFEVLIFSVVPFNKITVSFKYLITSSFASLFVSVIPEHVTSEIPFLSFLSKALNFSPKALVPASTKRFSKFFSDLGKPFFANNFPHGCN